MTERPKKRTRYEFAKERQINELTKEDIGKRVKILGRIVQVNSDGFMVDDGDNQIDIISKEEIPFEVGNVVRVFGWVSYIDDKYVLNSTIVQDMKDLDQELYKRVQAVKKKALNR